MGKVGKRWSDVNNVQRDKGDVGIESLTWAQTLTKERQEMGIAKLAAGGGS